MKVIDVRYLSDRGWLGFLFEGGMRLYYGAGVVPGTDVLTYRFVHSSGFTGSGYKKGKDLACEYSRGLGFPGVQKHLESFTGVGA